MDDRDVGISRNCHSLKVFCNREDVCARRLHRSTAGAVGSQQCSIDVKEDELHSSESGGSGRSSSSGGANRRLRLVIGRGEIVMLMLFPISLGSISACPIVAKSSLS